MAELFDASDETVAIANTLHAVGVRGMIPGFSTVELTDLDGSSLSIPVIVDPADIRMKIGQQIGWYYIPNDSSYEIRSVTSSQPSIVPVTYSSRTYIATAKAPGYATLTFSIYNRREQRNQTMQFNVIAGSPDPLVFSGPQTTVPV